MPRTLCKVRSTNLISLIISNILLIWYLAWCHFSAAQCHNQSNCLWSSVTPGSSSPRLLNIGPLSSGPVHTAATILPPPPPFFPIVRRQLCVRHTSCSLSGHTRCLKWTILRSNTNYHLLWSATLPRPLGSDEDEILNSLDDLDQAWVIKQNLQTFQRSSLFSTQQLIST